MLWSNSSNHFERLAPLLLCVACSNSSAAADAGGGCSVDASGNVADHADLASCASVAQDDAGLFALAIEASTPQLARISARIELGDAPAAGALSSDTITTSWSLEAIAAANSCTFQAGAGSVPAGSFTLDLSSVDPKAGTAHGTLSFVAYVHAPPSTDCGYDDLENFSIRF